MSEFCFGEGAFRYFGEFEGFVDFDDIGEILDLDFVVGEGVTDVVEVGEVADAVILKLVDPKEVFCLVLEGSWRPVVVHVVEEGGGV